MSREELIKQRVEKALALLDSEEPLKADPYFFPRLEARIHSQEQLPPASEPGTRRWQLVLLASLAGVNLVTAGFWISHTMPKQERQETLSYIAQDYDLITESGDWLIEGMEE